MTKNFFLAGFLILSLLIFAQPSSAHDPVFVQVGDGGSSPVTGCGGYDPPYIGFAACGDDSHGGSGGYGSLAMTYVTSDGDQPVQFNTDLLSQNLNYSVTSESSEFAGVHGTCGTGNNFDWQPGFNGDSFSLTITTPGSCYYYCKFHPVSQMRGVIIFPGGVTNQPPNAVSLTPMNVITAPGTPQSFTVAYSDPDGYQDIADASIHITDLMGGPNNEWPHYNPQTNSFTLTGAAGSCSPGGSGTLATSFMALNCSASTVSGSGTNLSVTFNLTPQPSFSGPINSMFITATDQASHTNGKVGGYWIVDRPPSANTITPVNISTSVGTPQSFTAGFSDPDGYLNISDAGLYLPAGPTNVWAHYSPTANKFTLTGANGSCSPGQATTLSNGTMTLNCASSSASGTGTTLNVTFNLTPLAPSGGKQFLQVPALIDSAGKSDGKILGTWTITSF